MQELLQLIERLAERIHAHRQMLAQSEAMTRSALIDPMLRTLDWDTEDPSVVIPEYSIPSNSSRADYALFGSATTADSRRPDVIVEAKKLGEELDEAATQAVNYCTLDGYESFAVTDGRRWRVYRTLARGALADKLISQFDIVQDAPEIVLLKALALWRPAVLRGVLQDGTARTAVVRGAPASPPTVPLEPSGSVAGGISESETSDLPAVAGAPWTSLADLTPVQYSKPAELKVPSGDTVGVKSWKSLMTEVVKWLVAQEQLQDANPVKAGGKYILARSPEHPDGRPFTAPGHAQPWYVETSYPVGPLVRHTCTIVRTAGGDPAEFKVRVRTDGS